MCSRAHSRYTHNRPPKHRSCNYPCRSLTRRSIQVKSTPVTSRRDTSHPTVCRTSVNSIYSTLLHLNRNCTILVRRLRSCSGLRTLRRSHRRSTLLVWGNNPSRNRYKQAPMHLQLFRCRRLCNRSERLSSALTRLRLLILIQERKSKIRTRTRMSRRRIQRLANRQRDKLLNLDRINKRFKRNLLKGLPRRYTTTKCVQLA